MKIDSGRCTARAHVLVNPTFVDTFGLAILESLACGTPVVTTPIPAHLGLELPLFLASTVDDFVKAIMKIHKLLSHDPHSYKRMCRAARNAATKYDVELVISPYRENVSGSGGKPEPLGCVPT